MKRIVAMMLAFLLMMPLGGCSLVTDALRDEMGDEFADALDAQQAQNKAELEQLGKDLEELGDEVGAELKDMIQDKLNTPAHPLGADPINTYDNKGYITRLSDIPESEVKNTKQLNIAEFDPLSALTETLMSNIDDPTTSGLEGIGNGLAFLTDMWSNAVKVTQLRVTEGKDGRLNIDYGDPIELKYSGKKKSLHAVLVDQYFSVSPSIIFTGSKKADEMIRSWFNLDGEGKYSMSMTFGRVYIGDCGYRLIFEGDKIYQVPHLHEDTEFRIYYKEDGKSTYLFDAAELLRNTRFELPKEEAAKVRKRLKESGYLD